MTDDLSPDFRSGFASILGKPNAGKSTLVNALIGEKLAAVSGLPQTTRERLNAIYTDDRMQVVFVDLPGLVEGTDKLNETLRQNVIDGLEGVDCVLHMIDVTAKQPVDPDMAEMLSAISTPVVALINKIDTRPKSFTVESWKSTAPAPFDPSIYAEILGVSATTGAGREELLKAVHEYMKPGPPLYDSEQITDRSLRFLATELIREKVYHLTHQEIPYSTAVTIDEFKERDRGKWYIAATIHVERDTQKGIVIGKGGSMLKKISQASRLDIERLTGAGIFLELHVKVSKNWRKSDNYLREFGYKGKGRRS